MTKCIVSYEKSPKICCGSLRTLRVSVNWSTKKKTALSEMWAKLFVIGMPAAGFFISVLIGAFLTNSVLTPLSFLLVLLTPAVFLKLILLSVNNSTPQTSFCYSQVSWGAVPGFITIMSLSHAFSLLSHALFQVKLVTPLFLIYFNAARSGTPITKGERELYGLELYNIIFRSRRGRLWDLLFVSLGRNMIYQTGKLFLGLRVLGETDGAVPPSAAFIVAAFCGPTVGLLAMSPTVEKIVFLQKVSLIGALMMILVEVEKFTTELGTACLLGLFVSKRVCLTQTQMSGFL